MGSVCIAFVAIPHTIKWIGIEMSDEVIYAVGDIHGMYDQLVKLLSDIEKDAKRRYPERSKIIVYLGDYIDRGPQSQEVVELLMSQPLKKHDFQEVFLKGNHEEMMIDYYEGIDRSTWLYNGGEETLDSYAPDDISIEHRDWLAHLPLNYARGDYFFVHAGVDPERTLDNQVPEDLLWIRGRFLRSNETLKLDNQPIKVVHGHSVTYKPKIKHNRIGVDTGAFATGTLSAAVLDGQKEDFIQVHGKAAPGY